MIVDAAPVETQRLLEAHSRVVAARDLLDAMATGHVAMDPDTLTNLAALLAVAARKARQASGWPARAA